MTFDIRHLLVYLCAALLAVAPGLAWGDAEECSSLVGKATSAEKVVAGLTGKSAAAQKAKAEKHFQDAFPVCEWASNQGSAKGQFELGKMYYRGKGVDQNKEKAAELFRTAAEQGHTDALDMLMAFAKPGGDGAHYAQFQLGKIYHEGRGVIGDPQEAYFWLLLATHGGDKKAHQLKEKVKEYLDPNQIRTAVGDAEFEVFISNPSLDTIDSRTIIFIVLLLLSISAVGATTEWAHKFIKPLRDIKEYIAKIETTTMLAVSAIAFFLFSFLFWLFIGNRVFALMAAVMGPFFAVLATTLLHERWAKKERRQKLFNTLVALKKYTLSHNRAQALNEVKLEFNENYVVTAWEKFVDYMERPEEVREQERGEVLYDELLHCMATALGDRSKDIKRSFAPQAHRNLEKLDVNWKTSLLKVLVGEEPIATRDSKRGVAEALYLQGVRSRDGDGVPKNKEKAVRLFKEAAIQDFAKAQNALGEMYLDGEGVRKDEGKAIFWFGNAVVREGIAAAKNHLGVMLCAYSENMKKSIDKNDFNGLKNAVGSMKNVIDSAKEAIEKENTDILLEKAINNWKKDVDNLKNAIDNGGIEYATSNVKNAIKKMIRTARVLFKSASDQEFAAAQYNLGLMIAIAKGEKIKKNEIEFLMAAGQDLTATKYKLGLMSVKNDPADQSNKEKEKRK